MLQHILELEGDITAYDASDALAVAVCHHFQAQAAEKISGEMNKKSAGTGSTTGGGKRKKPGSWEDFIRKNPGKVQL